MSQKKVIVLGGGESGVGAAILAQKQGYEVFVSDVGEIKMEYKADLISQRIPWELGKHTAGVILAADEVVKSPGIPNTVELVIELNKKNIPVISEIEFASRYTNAELIAITGSNGKTTTTSITYDIFKRAGYNVGLAGNIGKSFAWSVAEDNYDHYILEVSSFQLDNIKTFKPKVAVILNITPDHLDRYNNDFRDYAKAKYRITENQDSSDFFIYGADDDMTSEMLLDYNIPATQMPFGITYQKGCVGYTENENLYIDHKAQFEMPLNQIAIKGTHNVYNSLAAGIAARIFDIRKDVVRESLTHFNTLEHRLEHVATIGAVDYINDSKATNVNSTWYALETMDKPVIWIAGGVDKGNDYTVLENLVRNKVKAIVCLGKDNLNIHQAFRRQVDLMVNTQTAAEAVQMAKHLADKGDAVLLSPACASFDLFENYEDRGNQFKLAVRDL